MVESVGDAPAQADGGEGSATLSRARYSWGLTIWGVDFVERTKKRVKLSKRKKSFRIWVKYGIR